MLAFCPDADSHTQRFRNRHAYPLRHLQSGNVYKVRLLLAQLGIPHCRVDVAQFRGEPRSLQFRAINPIGKVPTLQFEDGRVLSELGAILFYLAHGTRFLPDDRWDITNVLRWMFFEQYGHPTLRSTDTSCDERRQRNESV
jgi:glutathione S-transferase